MHKIQRNVILSGAKDLYPVHDQTLRSQPTLPQSDMVGLQEMTHHINIGKYRKMDTPQLETKLKAIHEALGFLWTDYEFHTRYLTTDQGFVVGIENRTLKLCLELASDSSQDLIQCHLGTRSAWYTRDDGLGLPTRGWYTLGDLAPWLGAESSNSVGSSEQDLEQLSQYLKHHMDTLIKLFKDPKTLMSVNGDKHE